MPSKNTGIQGWMRVKGLKEISVSRKTRQNRLSHSNVMKGFKSAWGRKRGK